MKQFDYPVTLKSGLRIRPVAPADIEATHAINLGRPAPTALYQWLYFDNPFREGRTTGWVVEHDDHGIVGKIWLIWWPATFQGRPIECVLSGDLYVDPRTRGMGAGVGLVRHQFDAFPEGLVLGSSANENSMGLWRKFDGFTVGVGNVRHQRFVSWLGPARAATASVPPLARPLGRVLARPPSGTVGRRPAEGRGWHEVAASDEELQAFVQRAEGQCDVTTRRSPELLRWRYEQCPVHAPRLVAVRDEGRIVGYLAMQVRARSARLGLKAAEVVDHLVDFDDARSGPRTLEASVDWARRAGADLVEWRGTNTRLPGLFQARSWVRRESEINPFVCYSAETERLGLRERNFHLVLGDGDAAIR